MPDRVGHVVGNCSPLRAFDGTRNGNVGPPDPFLGREIVDHQYQIVQKIGAGGMGSVYRAMQPAMNRMVAIKILHPRLTSRKDLASRFRREARAMSQLNHPNTVKVFTYGELPDGSLYIVMELLQGRSLNHAIRREGPMPVEKAVSLLVQVCGALEEAHQAGIVHRDLKPENIFLCNQPGLVDFPKVLDFGLAKMADHQLRPGSIILTQEGMVFGTPEFMSPEQAQGMSLDGRSDIYSLAVILFEALTGKLPFVVQTPIEFIQRHVLTPPRRLVDAAPERSFPEALEATIAKALAKQPDDRWPSATLFAQALAQSLVPNASAPVAGAPLAIPVPPPAVAAPAPARPPPTPASALRVPVGLLLMVAGSFLALGAVLAFVILYWFVR
jgi:eukaryotic-like serine/threonine-protein kinase